MNLHGRSRRAAFGLLDVVIGLSLLALMLGMLSMAATRRTQFATHSATQRELIRDVEAALLTLQAGDAPVLPAGRRANVETLDQAETPAGTVWIRLTLEADDVPAQRAQLVGLVPAAALQRWEVQP